MIEEGDICCATLVEWDVLVLVRATVDHGGGLFCSAKQCQC